MTNRPESSAAPVEDALSEVEGVGDFDWRICALFWLVPLVAFLSQLGRWSMSGDEFYTWFDSSKPVDELLSYERKPLYYLLCHMLLGLDLGLSVETVIRLPAAVAASLIPPAFYGLLARRSSRVACFSAIIALANPWLFQMSQFGRFYSLAFLFATVSVLSAWRWLGAKHAWGWLVGFAVSGLLAGLSHTPAVLVIPAAIIGLLAAWNREEPQHVAKLVKRYGLAAGFVAMLCALAGLYVLKDVLYFWFNSNAGEFGAYSIPQILIALAIFGGISTWALAFVPLMQLPRNLRADDFYLALTCIFTGAPLLILVPLGGGVAARYLLFCLPCVFVLAARHWSQVDRTLPTWQFRLGLGVAILAFNLPYLASTYQDANHFDYRETASQIERLELIDPLIVATAPDLLDLYLRPESESQNLTDFSAGVPREIINASIGMAREQERPLLLVSREDRARLSVEDQAWLFARFAIIRVIENPRFDHRRHRTVIYEYRPDKNQAILEMEQFTMVSSVLPATDANRRTEVPVR